MNANAEGLRDFAKANPQLIVKNGYYEGAALTEDEVRTFLDAFAVAAEKSLGKRAG